VRPFADFSNQTSTLLLPVWAFVFSDLGSSFILLMAAKEVDKRTIGEVFSEGRNSPLRAEFVSCARWFCVASGDSMQYM
jgi:hypothetical protein